MQYSSVLLAACNHMQIRDDDAIYSEAFYTTPNEFVLQVKVSALVTVAGFRFTVSNDRGSDSVMKGIWL